MIGNSTDLTTQPRKAKKYGPIPLEGASDAEKGFAAGLIDREGSLDISVLPRTIYLGGGRKNPLLQRDWSMIYRYPRLRVEMADYGEVSELARLFGERCLPSRGKYFRVRVMGGRCMRVLTIIYPMMKISLRERLLKTRFLVPAIRSLVRLNLNPIPEPNHVEVSPQFDYFPNLLFLC